MSDWSTFSVEIPGKEILQPVSALLETLLQFLDIAKGILEVVKAYLQDYGNPISALVTALIKLIEEVFLSLKTSGVYGYFDVPEPQVDPGFRLQSGGYAAFKQRFIASLMDTKDFNRPQPRAGSAGGFVLFVVESANAIQMINNMSKLLGFFGKALTTPRYEAPASFKVEPVDRNGDPILAVAAAFAGPQEAVQLSWILPTTQASPDQGFLDAATQFSNEFVPPGFLIEKSEVNPASAKIFLDKMSDADAAGMVEYDRPVNVDKGVAGRFATVKDNQVFRRETLKDSNGEPFIKFQQYFAPGLGTDILGQLGRYRYLDTDVVFGKTYYYRVRAFSGELKFSGKQLADLPTKTEDLETGAGGGASDPHFVYPGEDVVMGKPTAIIRATVTKPTEDDFDVIETVRSVFLTAFSLDFHLELPATAEFNGDGTPKDNTPNSAVGVGSLLSQAGMLAQFQSVEILNKIAQFETVQASMQGSLTPTEMPWEKFNLRRQVARLTDAVVSSMLQHDSAATTFKDLVTGLPRGPISTQRNLQGLTQLDLICTKLTTRPSNELVIETYKDAYVDVGLRLNVLSLITFFKTFTLGGEGVDWIAIQPLRDIIPWCGQYLYDLLDKITALLEAYKGTSNELVQYIELIERKITALETFVKYLLEILGFVENLQFSASMLAANGISGDVFQWIQTLETAGGTPPSSGPGGYAAGICLAYTAPDIAAFAAAFGIIFGA